MAHPARTAPVTGIAKIAVYARTYTAGSAAAVADTHYLGDITTASDPVTRQLQSLETSDRTIAGLGPIASSLSFTTVLAPSNTILETIRSAHSSGVPLTLMLCRGTEPDTGAKNYVISGAYGISNFQTGFSNNVHTVDISATCTDTSTLTFGFNVSAFPSV